MTNILCTFFLFFISDRHQHEYCQHKEIIPDDIRLHNILLCTLFSVHTAEQWPWRRSRCTHCSTVAVTTELMPIALRGTSVAYKYLGRLEIKNSSYITMLPARGNRHVLWCKPCNKMVGYQNSYKMATHKSWYAFVGSSFNKPRVSLPIHTPLYVFEQTSP